MTLHKAAIKDGQHAGIKTNLLRDAKCYSLWVKN